MPAFRMTSRQSSNGVGITLVELLVVASIFAAVTAMTWTVHNRNRWMLERERAVESTIPERRQRIEGLIDDVTESVQFRFVAGTPDGPPLAGVQVRLTADTFYGPPKYLGDSDAEGRIAFKRVRHGTYRVSLHPRQDFWGETKVLISPGKPISASIVVPPPTTPLNIVTVMVRWPEDLEVRSPQFVFDIHSQQLTVPLPALESPIVWTPFDASKRERSASFWVTGQGEVFSRPRPIGIADPGGGRRGLPVHMSRWKIGDGRYPRQPEGEPEGQITLYEPVSTLTSPGKDYRVTNLAVVVPLSHSQVKPAVGEQIILIRSDSSGWDHQFVTTPEGTVLELTPTAESLDQIRRGFDVIDRIRAIPATSESTSSATPNQSSPAPGQASPESPSSR